MAEGVGVRGDRRLGWQDSEKPGNGKEAALKGETSAINRVRV